MSTEIEIGCNKSVVESDYHEAQQVAKEVAMKLELTNSGCLTENIPSVFGDKWQKAFSVVRERFSEYPHAEQLLLLANREYAYACQVNATFLNLAKLHSPEYFDDDDPATPVTPITPEEYANHYGWAEVLYEGVTRTNNPSELYADFTCCDVCGYRKPEGRDIISAKALSWFFEAAELFSASKSEAFDRLYEAAHALALSEGILMWNANSDYESDRRREIATQSAEVRHSKPGGAKEKRERIRAAWASGNFSSRDECAEQECGALGMSFSTARKALRKTPQPNPWPARAMKKPSHC